MDAEKLTVCHQLNQPKVTNLMLSPRGNTLVTLGPYFGNFFFYFIQNVLMYVCVIERASMLNTKVA